MANAQAAPLVAPSQGVHLVFARSFLPGNSALMVPRTDDGRVMFAIPWHDHTLLGTTDTPIKEAIEEPTPHQEEIDFLLETAARYFTKPPTRNDILSIFVGIRPLVRQANAKNTAALSRDHTIHVDAGLLTITGGKWTTYRNMAEDAVNQAMRLAHLPRRPCRTRTLPIHGYHREATRFGRFAVYGADASSIQALILDNPRLGDQLHSGLPTCGAEIVWATRHELARTLEDVLARRTRALFLNAGAALAMAPQAAALMARELGRDNAWQENQIQLFAQTASLYMRPKNRS